TAIEQGGARDCFLRASHTGYRTLGVIHTRTIRSVDGERTFVIEDELDGEGVHDFEINFQLAPKCRADVAAAEDGILCRIQGDQQVELTVSGPASLGGSVQPSISSATYGGTVPALRARFCVRAAVPARISTNISWAEVTETASGGSNSANKSQIRNADTEGALLHI